MLSSTSPSIKAALTNRQKHVLSATCSCSALAWYGYCYVHEAGCPFVPVVPCYSPVDYVPILPHPDELVGCPPKNRTRKTPKPPSYRFKLQFNFTRPINIELWRKIKAPQGWRKCPTSQKGQEKYWGVRFQCDDLKYALTPEEISLLHMKLLMCLKVSY